MSIFAPSIPPPAPGSDAYVIIKPLCNTQMNFKIVYCMIVYCFASHLRIHHSYIYRDTNIAGEGLQN